MRVQRLLAEAEARVGTDCAHALTLTVQAQRLAVTIDESALIARSLLLAGRCQLWLAQFDQALATTHDALQRFVVTRDLSTGLGFRVTGEMNDAEVVVRLVTPPS